MTRRQGSYNCRSSASTAELSLCVVIVVECFNIFSVPMHSKSTQVRSIASCSRCSRTSNVGKYLNLTQLKQFLRGTWQVAGDNLLANCCGLTFKNFSCFGQPFLWLHSEANQKASSTLSNTLCARNIHSVSPSPAA